MARLDRDFFRQDTLTVARSLPGLFLARRLKDELLLCRIVETEAYIGPIDKACHAYGGRRTARTEVMFGPPGHAYIYLIYGMYCCLNFVTEEEGRPCAVLLRGLEPVYGTDTVARLRFGCAAAEMTAYQRKNFLNGPGKCCKGLSLTTSYTGMDLTGEDLFLLQDPSDIGLPPVPREQRPLKTGKRIGIDYAEEALDFPWRFYL